MIMSARPPLRAKLVLVAPFLGKPALMGGYLGRRRSARVLPVQKCFDVLPPAREHHHLLARVAVKLPSSVSSGDFDSISEPLSLAGEFAAVICGREGLRTIDFDGIEAAYSPSGRRVMSAMTT